MSHKPIYCWDTSVFVAWLKGEADKPLADIEAVVADIDAKKATLLVPVTIIAEMQKDKFTDQQWTKFQGVLRRSSVVVASMTPAIAQRASELRDRAEVVGRKIQTADATIIATAMIYKAHALHTFEPKHIHLSETPIVDSLQITQPLPITGQKGLL